MPVATSGFIKDVKYFEGEKKMLVFFSKDETVIEYSEVPEDVYRSLIEASSTGRYFNAYVARNYPWRKLGGKL